MVPLDLKRDGEMDAIHFKESHRRSRTLATHIYSRNTK